MRLSSLLVVALFVGAAACSGDQAGLDGVDEADAAAAGTGGVAAGAGGGSAGAGGATAGSGGSAGRFDGGSAGSGGAGSGGSAGRADASVDAPHAGSGGSAGRDAGVDASIIVDTAVTPDAAPDASSSPDTSADSGPGADAAPDDTSSPTDVRPDDCDLPRCLEDVRRLCVPSGACTQQATQLGSSNTCWAGGVKRLQSVEMRLGATYNQESRWRRANGNACYTIDVTGAATDTTFDAVFRGPQGGRIARGKFDSATLTFKIVCESGSDETHTVSALCAGLGVYTGCTAGTCP